jgi:hypothetical protein
MWKDRITELVKNTKQSDDWVHNQP